MLNRWASINKMFEVGFLAIQCEDIRSKQRPYATKWPGSSWYFLHY